MMLKISLNNNRCYNLACHKPTIVIKKPKFTNFKKHTYGIKNDIITHKIINIQKSKNKLKAINEQSSNDSKIETNENIEITDKLNGVNLYLIGMMGSGKSTVGKELAEKINYMYFDSDDLIEQGTKASIAEIILSEGIDNFRDMETSVMREVYKYKNVVMSTGGGMILRPENWSYMHQGLIIWLKGSKELLTRRVVKDGIAKRPLLNSERENSPIDNDYDFVLEKIENILKERDPLYANADFTISLDDSNEEFGMPVEAIIEKILVKIDKEIEETREQREKQSSSKFKLEAED